MKLIPSISMPSWITGLRVITSSCESCHKSLPLRYRSAHKIGITMHGFWYCSARCFQSAVEREVLRLLESGKEPAAFISRMPLGLDLISHGLLTVEQLKKATDEQKETGGEIGELLVRQGSVSEKQVTAIRASQWGCPVFVIPKYPMSIGINLPAALMRIYSMTPVHYVATTNLLLVGFVHSVEYGLLYAIEQIVGCKTKPCFVTPSDFQIQMQQQEKERAQAGSATAREVEFERIQTPAQIARTLCSSGLEVEADEALIGRCKECLWARLTSGAIAVDLLFRVG
jgi:Type II secretion system (T2SS), protein E, N-terminal domain